MDSDPIKPTAATAVVLMINEETEKKKRGKASRGRSHLNLHDLNRLN